MRNGLGKRAPTHGCGVLGVQRCLAWPKLEELWLSSVKQPKLSLAALLVWETMGVSKAREVTQAGKLRLAPSQPLPAPLPKHVLCLHHGNLCCLTGGFRQEEKCCLVLWGEKNFSQVAQLWNRSLEAVETPSLERFKCTWMQPWATWFSSEGGSAFSKGWVRWFPESHSSSHSVIWRSLATSILFVTTSLPQACFKR